MSKKLKYYYIKVVRIFTRSRNTPESMARGIAVGVFVGLTPSVGFQMLPAILLAFLVKGNKILALLFTYVSNPITTIPLYALYFYLGNKILPSLVGARFDKIKDVVVHFSFDKLFSVGVESLLVLWAGALVIAIPSGLISYFFFYRNILFFRRRKERKQYLKKKSILKSPPPVDGEETPEKDLNLHIPVQSVNEKIL